MIPDQIGGPHFEFVPYHYGPFDKAVFWELEDLSSKGKVEISYQKSWRTFRLTVAGQLEGEPLLSKCDPTIREFIEECSRFVRRLSFTQLVSAIYKAFPEMKENSVFRG